MIAAFRQEIRPMLRLAAPLAMAELGWMSMGFVDAIMAGRLGAAQSVEVRRAGDKLVFVPAEKSAQSVEVKDQKPEVSPSPSVV